MNLKAGREMGLPHSRVASRPNNICCFEVLGNFNIHIDHPAIWLSHFQWTSLYHTIHALQQTHAGFILHLKLLYLWQHKFKYPRSQTASRSALSFSYSLYTCPLVLLSPPSLDLFLAHLSSLFSLSSISSLTWFGEILLFTPPPHLHVDLLSGHHIHYHLFPSISISCASPHPVMTHTQSPVDSKFPVLLTCLLLLPSAFLT